MVSQVEVLSVPWITALLPFPRPTFSDSTLTIALTQYHLSPGAVVFIQHHMLMEEKRAVLRFLASETPYKTLSTLAQLCGRHEELLRPVLDDFLSTGIAVACPGDSGETTWTLTDDPIIRSVVDQALAAYYRYPELRRLLAEYNMG
jgi:hypothetical protein